MLTKITRQHWLSILGNKHLQLSTLYLLSILIPFLIQGPQLLIGTLVNLILILSISKFKFKSVIPILFLPSISVYIHGLLFAGATHFLLLLLPVIALSNAIYVLAFKKLRINIGLDYVTIFIASVLKAIILLTFTYTMISITWLPEIFLGVMGITQLITALLGGHLAILLLKISPSTN